MSRSIVAAIEQLSYANLHPLKRGVEGARGPGWLHDCTWQAKTHLSCFALAWAKFSLTRALPLPVHLPANVPVNDCLPYLRKDWRANLSRIKQKLSTHTEMAESAREIGRSRHMSHACQSYAVYAALITLKSPKPSCVYETFVQKLRQLQPQPQHLHTASV